MKYVNVAFGGGRCPLTCDQEDLGLTYHLRMTITMASNLTTSVLF